MGLDMYLNGRKSLWAMNDAKARTEDGFELDGVVLKLGYWRKHPNLHGYIVQTFAGGKDECQEIELDADALKLIIAAVADPKNLPHTTGFFFGQSAGDADEAAEDVAIFTKALAWLEAAKDADKNIEFYRSVYYQASW